MKSAEDYSKKIISLSWVFIFFLIIIALRLVYLQIFFSHNFLALSVKNFLRTESIISPRGNILDCHGTLLATNRPVTTLYWQGSGNKNLTDFQTMLINDICETLNFPPEKIIRAIQYAEKTSTKTVIASDISLQQLSKIIEQFPDNPNIYINTSYKRFYPHKTIASHILGHINKMDNDIQGKMGLEKILHTQLQGQQGQLLKTINSMGCNIQETQTKKARAGETIVTTLDLPLQIIAENLFPENYAGMLLLMNPKDGALKVLVSRPNFDPTIFLDTIALPDWQELQNGKPFLNRALDTCYPPASTFKLITISAALEHNIVKPDDSLYCCGYFNFCGRRYYCDKRAGHGQLTVKEAVAKSCNILFYYIATKISVDLLAEYAQKFGLGVKTNIIFPENPGLVPSSDWKLKEKGERWWQGETLSCAIGQSYLLTTPIQIARMISSIFEGYLVTPRILQNDPISYQPLPLEETTRLLLKKYMKLAVKEGTCVKLKSLDTIKIFAKTGTAQTCSLSYQKKSDRSSLAHAWCVCYFYLQNEEPMTLVILIENAGSSRLATSVAKEFLTRYERQKKHQA